MGDVVNLNKFRKKRNRKEAEATARNNRVSHGRSGAQKKRDLEQQEKRDALLDQKRLSGEDTDENDNLSDD